MKKIISIMLSLIMVFAMVSTAFASDSYDKSFDFGEPIDEISYFDEELQATVTDRFYFIPDDKSSVILSKDLFSRNKSGKGTYRNERVFDWSNNDVDTVTFAQGYFVWGNGKVSVSNPKGGYNYFPSSYTILENDTTSGTGKYAYAFNKYAYVKYIFKFKDITNKTQDLSVQIRVSENGNLI